MLEAESKGKVLNPVKSLKYIHYSVYRMKREYANWKCLHCLYNEKLEQWYIYSFLFCILKSKVNTAKIIKKESSCHKLKFSNYGLVFLISNYGLVFLKGLTVQKFGPLNV